MKILREYLLILRFYAFRHGFVCMCVSVYVHVYIKADMESGSFLVEEWRTP